MVYVGTSNIQGVRFHLFHNLSQAFYAKPLSNILPIRLIVWYHSFVELDKAPYAT